MRGNIFYFQLLKVFPLANIDKTRSSLESCIRVPYQPKDNVIRGMRSPCRQGSEVVKTGALLENSAILAREASHLRDVTARNVAYK